MFGTRRYERLLTQSEARYQEQLQFTREVIRRNELAFIDFSRTQSELREEIRVSFRDLREGLQANTQAILRVLDRLDNGDQPAAT